MLRLARELRDRPGDGVSPERGDDPRLRERWNALSASASDTETCARPSSAGAVLGADGRIVETGGHGVRREDLPRGTGMSVRVPCRTPTEPGPARGARRVEAAARLDADHLDARVAGIREESDRVRSAAHACDEEVGQPSERAPARLRLPADDGGSRAPSSGTGAGRGPSRGWCVVAVVATQSRIASLIASFSVFDPRSRTPRSRRGAHAVDAEACRSTSTAPM